MSPEQIETITDATLDGLLPPPVLSRPSPGREAATFGFESLMGTGERLLDVLTVAGTVYLCWLLYLATARPSQAMYRTSAVLPAAGAFGLLFVFLLERHGGYRMCLSLLGVRETERTLRVTLEALLIAVLVTFVTAMTTPRRFVLTALVAVPTVLTLQKWEVCRAVRSLRSRGYGNRRALILGTGSVARRIFTVLANSPKFGLDPVAFVGDDPYPGRQIHECSYHGRRAATVLAGPVCPQLLRDYGASVLVIASPLGRKQMSRILGEMSRADISTYFVPENLATPGYWLGYDELDGILLAHFTKERPRYFYNAAKRLLDLSTATALLVLASPLLLAIAALVKLDSRGPALFRQQRVGKDGRLFCILKFRTMFVEARPYARSPQADGDRRITRIGHVLRRTSLDELPQLVNVLAGEMSLVGPRPEMPYVVEGYDTLQRQRLAVQPGMTGLWQLSADRAVAIHQNMEYDLYYVRHRSILMDIAILLHTFLFAAHGI